MKNTILYGTLLVFATCIAAIAIGQEKQTPFEENTVTSNASESYGDKLGTVQFPVSCNEAAARHMERGIALLHHMTYQDARSVFEDAVKMLLRIGCNTGQNTGCQLSGDILMNIKENIVNTGDMLWVHYSK